MVYTVARAWRRRAAVVYWRVPFVEVCAAFAFGVAQDRVRARQRRAERFDMGFINNAAFLDGKRLEDDARRFDAEGQAAATGAPGAGMALLAHALKGQKPLPPGTLLDARGDVVTPTQAEAARV